MASAPIYAVTGDLGFGGFDSIMRNYPERFLNTGASEQAALDICVGLYLSGKIPVFYTITPFLLRGFETLRTYINHSNMKVILVGSGRDFNYFLDGISHVSDDIPKIMATLLNTTAFYPETPDQIPTVLDAAIFKDGPSFISLIK